MTGRRRHPDRSPWHPRLSDPGPALLDLEIQDCPWQLGPQDPRDGLCPAGRQTLPHLDRSEDDE